MSKNIFADKGISFGYNADGIRTYKQLSDAGTTITRHEYILNGSQIVKETVFVNSVESYTLVYLYDETGAPLGYRYRTPSYASGVFDGYFFEKNLQGDIVAVYNQSGTKVAGYTYDAWGKVAVTYYNGGSTTAAQYNPFRYRGYYYDTETGWYYLQNRYYDPVMGRFINADGYVSTGQGLLGCNMFAYCANNPITRRDSSGKLWVEIFIFAVVTIATVFTASSCVSDVPLQDTSDTDNSWADNDPILSVGRHKEYDDAVNEAIDDKAFWILILAAVGCHLLFRSNR